MHGTGRWIQDRYKKIQDDHCNGDNWSQIMLGIREEHTDRDEGELYNLLLEIGHMHTDMNKKNKAGKKANDQQEKKKEGAVQQIIEMAKESQNRSAYASDREHEKSEEERGRRKERMSKAHDRDADLATFGKELRQVDKKRINADQERLKLDGKRMEMERQECRADRGSRKGDALKKFKLMMETISSAMRK